ncbi:hypothetical protein HK405_010427, partial [Cladochytrium tenue]
GGKDSCMAMMHCVANGHEIVALANLHPPDGGRDELDSYMYQTVGHDAVSLLGECAELPMVRRAITGGARATGPDYDATNAETADDEVEDLYALLADVKARFPDIEAVSVGAILSNYQRVRVESV